MPQQVADDIHAFGVIGMRIILNLLHSALNCAILNPERRWIFENKSEKVNDYMNKYSDFSPDE
jgi:hypothetical protein